MKKPPPLALELFLNGKRAALASSKGMSVLSAILSWVEAGRVKHPGGITHPRPALLEIHLGGLSRGSAGRREHVRWLNSPLKVGDVVTIRVTSTTRTQPPVSRKAELPQGTAPSVNAKAPVRASRPKGGAV